MKKILMATAALLLMMTMTVLTSCSKDDDDTTTPNPTDDITLVGNWTADITNKTFPLWNYGPALHMMNFNADGTGSFETYYTLEEQPVARDKQTFTYTTTSDGHLTMKMEDGDFNYTYKFTNGQLTLTYEGDAVTWWQSSTHGDRRNWLRCLMLLVTPYSYMATPVAIWTTSSRMVSGIE